MSNPYTTNQQWDQPQILFGQQNLQLENDFNFPSYNEPAQSQQQSSQQQQQQQPSYSNAYHYSQAPSNAPISQSSSLHGAFPTSQQSSHSRSSSYTNLSSQTASTAGAYLHGVYGSTNATGGGHHSSLPSFQSNAQSFTFGRNNIPSASLPASTVDVSVAAGASNFITTSPGPMQETFSHTTGLTQSYYPPKVVKDNSPIPQAKRHRPNSNEETNHEDPDTDMGTSDAKESNKIKPARACARCKNLKVRCESKTDTDPCKRCLNGGHECVIPGRKIRRTPPKREHLLNQIQSQAKEIERLMQQLESMTAKSEQSPEDRVRQTSPLSLQSPVLSPSTTTDSYFGSDAPAATPGESANTATNKAIEDWISKARESLQEFGSFIGIGGAGMPKSYLVDEDFENPDSSEDDEFVDVQGELEGFGNAGDRYGVAVEDPEGDGFVHHERDTSNRIRHKSSASSFGTTRSGGGQTRKKNPAEHDKPANLPVEASPFGLFGNMSLRGPRSRASSADAEDDDKGSGIAREDFFRPSPAPDTFIRQLTKVQHQAPVILTKGIITPMEAEKLFQIYFSEMNLSVSLLDPVLYTAQRTFWRSPFLFTVVCAIASRFYTDRPGLYQQAMHYAQLAAGTALISGNKNVEMCSAYILLSLYPIPTRRWEDQRGWLYLGLAIRTATDLNLHLPTTAKPLNENHAREMLNRTRVWLNCFNLDRSTGSQYGKPPIISNMDYTANHSEDWWKSSPYNMRHFDIHICAYNAELKLMSGFISKIYSDPHHPTGLNKEVDFEGIATATDDELKSLGEKWFSMLAQTDLTDPENCFRTGLLRLAYSYARLIALSYGFQHAFGKNDGQDENPFLMRCLSAASDVVNAVVTDICRPSQLHYLRHGPEAQSVFVTFASAFLVKLLQPKFSSYLTPEKRVEIRSLVQQVIDLLGSPEVAIDDRHGPKLYSRFLRNLLAKPMARLDSNSQGGSSNNASRPRIRRPKSSSSQDREIPAPSDLSSSEFNHPSPATSGSLSPPPAEAALSFDNFAPVGGIDPFAPDNYGSILSAAGSENSASSDMTMTDFFQPSLPFDNDILQSIQSLSDPSGWQDISLPGLNWMTQFQQNLGLDLRGADTSTYDTNMNYMTGPVH